MTKIMVLRGSDLFMCALRCSATKPAERTLGGLYVDTGCCEAARGLSLAERLQSAFLPITASGPSQIGQQILRPTLTPALIVRDGPGGRGEPGVLKCPCR